MTSNLPTRRKSTKHRFCCSPAEWTTFMEAIAQGMSVETASYLANLKPKTVESWLTKGRALEDIEDDLLPGTQARECVRFLGSYRSARSFFEARHVSNITSHSNSNQSGAYQASCWLLERRRYKDYSLKYQMDQESDRRVLEVIKFLMDNLSPQGQQELTGLLQLIPMFKSEFEDKDNP